MLSRQELESLVTGISKRHRRARADSIRRLAIVVPPVSIPRRSGDTVKPLATRSRKCRREPRFLAASRDALLPKRISGEPRVAEVRCTVEAAS